MVLAEELYTQGVALNTGGELEIGGNYRADVFVSQRDIRFVKTSKIYEAVVSIAKLFGVSGIFDAKWRS